MLIVGSSLHISSRKRVTRKLDAHKFVRMWTRVHSQRHYVRMFHVHGYVERCVRVRVADV
jgi:hypothetical protein